MGKDDTTLTVADTKNGEHYDQPLKVGFLVYENQDQIDFTGPFEVLSRMTDIEIYVIAKSLTPVKDIKRLTITPDTAIANAPELDLLVVSGGFGQHDLMHDTEVLSFIHKHYLSGKYIMSVCTGALLCGAAGILEGVRATTHWASWEFLKYYGAIPVKSRYVVDGKLLSTAGVTAGIDGALKLVSILRGEAEAKEIQLELEYAPDPPFNSGTPETAEQATIEAYYRRYGHIKQLREEDAIQFAAGAENNPGYRIG
ncbi:DJ-1/PfpI family protein [Chitinophaga filiformis]|uniref:DJ-1/PfpI family protein n=1 Tax=Chitinophaga filiformis TaxID=104663 RepID=A0ABY4I8L1_CHIFI|nr:DJ-1/PfpI family protein [Chitinophaga filiformis]UPK71026.1 DJ-1/PfpI family protein [Chitinophaga filiformis]